MHQSIYKGGIRGGGNPGDPGEIYFYTSKIVTWHYHNLLLMGILLKILIGKH